MTESQKTQIRKMRNEGYGYIRIANALGLSENTVKSYCRRNSLAGQVIVKETETKDKCRQCGKKLIQVQGRKPRTFCSDECRIVYWKLNAEKMRHLKKIHISCAECGASFYDYARNNRKFCSHECYVKNRYRDGEGDE